MTLARQRWAASVRWRRPQQDYRIADAEYGRDDGATSPGKPPHSDYPGSMAEMTLEHLDMEY